MFVVRPCRYYEPSARKRFKNRPARWAGVSSALRKSVATVVRHVRDLTALGFQCSPSIRLQADALHMSFPIQTTRRRRYCRFEVLEERRMLANVPAGFTESVIASGLTSPITFDIEASGRIWLAFQDGRIQVVEDDQLLPTPAFQLDADGTGERGLQGLELDPDFESNGYIYVYYTAATPESHNRVSRLTVDQLTGNTIVPGSEVVLLDLPGFSTLPTNQDPIWHMGGAVHFLPDGTLAVQVGDHLNNVLVQNNNAPMGKVLRLNTDGTPAVDNPFYDPADNNPPGGNNWNGNAPGDVDWIDYVWASGLRNPYSGDVDPETGRFFINDVGEGTWEEINDASDAGENFGWPTTEGYFNAIAFPDFTNPFYAYSHGEDCAITGGAFYSTPITQFPAEYHGKYFFSQFCSGKIKVIDPDNSNNVQEFITGAAYPMNIEYAADGSMYYIARGAGAGGAPGIGTGQLLKVEYAAAVPPQIVQHPSDQLVSVGYSATFAASVAGSNPLSFQWQRNDGGGFVDIPDATSSELVLGAVSLGDDGALFRVVVTNPHGVVTSDAATLDVTSDTPPTAQILLPDEGATYRAGDIISFAGTATDLEDGALTPSSLTWQIDFHHDTHSHPFLPPTSGIAGGQFQIPVNSETSPNVWFRIRLIATDSAGLETEVIRDIHPVTSEFTPTSNVDGLSIRVDGQPKETPIHITGVVNVNRSLEAPETVQTGSTTAYFVQWLDGTTSRERVISTPDADRAYVALYEASIAESLMRINFQLEGVQVPDGYLPDAGQVFGDRGNGWSYGWSSDHTDLARDRNVNVDQRFDTLVHFHGGANWEIALPNGTYWVTASIGDAEFESTHTLNVEGVNYWTNEFLAANEFVTSIHQVMVADGRLTLNQGMAGDKATRINFLEVSTQPPSTALLPFAASDVDLDGRLDLDDALAFAAGWGADGVGLSLEQRVRQGDLDFDGDTDTDDWTIFNARWLQENNAPISLDALLSPIAGDYNRSGMVTSEDYRVWKQAYGSSDGLAADGNGDQIVDAADYTVWRNNLGASTGPPIVLDNLVLYVDPSTGDAWLKNDTAEPLDLIAYGIESTGAALLPDNGNWNSLADQEFAGWEEAAPSTSAISELNAADVLSLAPGQAIHLGTVFDVTRPLEGLSLEFGVSQSIEVMAGVAVFTEFIDDVNPSAVDELAPLLGWNEIPINETTSAIEAVDFPFVTTNGAFRQGGCEWDWRQSPQSSATEDHSRSAINLLALRKMEHRSGAVQARQRDFEIAVDAALEELIPGETRGYLDDSTPELKPRLCEKTLP